MAGFRPLAICHLRAIGCELPERLANTILPGMSAIAVQVEVRYQVYHLGKRHAMPKYTRNQPGVIPVFFIKGGRPTFDAHLIAVFIGILKIAMGFSFAVFYRDNGAFRYVGRNDKGIFQAAGKNSIGLAIQATDKRKPLFIIVLKRIIAVSREGGRTSTFLSIISFQSSSLVSCSASKTPFRSRRGTPLFL